MPSGITGASLTSFVNGTEEDGPTVYQNDLNLKTNGVNNDGGTITTDGSGNMTVVSVSNGQGVVRGTFFHPDPPILASNVTLNSGNTNTYTCTGVGTPTIPSGIKAVYLHVQFTPNGAGAQPTFMPHGTAWASGKGASIGSPAASQPIAASFWCPVDGGGQIDVKGNVANIVGLYIGIGAYLI